MDSEQFKVLVVDDEPEWHKLWERILSAKGYNLSFSFDGETAIAEVEKDPDIDLAILDINLPGISGIDVLREIKRRNPEIEAVMVTGLGSVENAVAAMKAGAHDFLTKPFASNDEAVIAIERALDHRTLIRKNRNLKAQLDVASGFGGIIGESRKMQDVFKLASSSAQSSSNVLIQGESGTGKELLAVAIHRCGPRRDKPLIIVNCAAIPETLLESELFGHVKGAFTDARKDRKGLFEEANNGTIFLDEISEIPPATQVKLLRVLQNGEVRRVGSNDTLKVDVRAITATNRDLKAMMERGTFRDDLYYRLNVMNIAVPPLRERREDIPIFACHFLRFFCAQMTRRIHGIRQDALSVLCSFNWPGNVRQLRNVIERAVVLQLGDAIEVSDLPQEIVNAVSAGGQPEPGQREIISFSRARKSVLAAFESQYLRALLNETAGNISEAARRAGIDRANLRKLLKKYSAKE